MSCGYCGNDTAELRRRTIQNGSIQFVQQCLKCGRAVSNPMAKSAIQGSNRVPPWDEGLNDRFERERHSQRVVDQKLAKLQWLQEHNVYLRTPAWRARRLAVLKRANGICEGCGNAAATQVHHLSYEHWKSEFLWELVAICDDCHERVHAEEEREAR